VVQRYSVTPPIQPIGFLPNFVPAQERQGPWRVIKRHHSFTLWCQRLFGQTIEQVLLVSGNSLVAASPENWIASKRSPGRQ